MTIVSKGPLSYKDAPWASATSMFSNRIIEPSGKATDKTISLD